MTGFAAAIRAFNKKAEKRTGYVVRAVGLNFLRDVSLGTPVDTGMARFNWFPTHGSPEEGTLEFEGGGAAASAAVMARGNDVFAQSAVEQGGVFWISNNLPYIKRLEEGHSAQGKLFFAKAAARVPDVVELSAREARRAIP